MIFIILSQTEGSEGKPPETPSSQDISESLIWEMLLWMERREKMCSL